MTDRKQVDAVGALLLSTTGLRVSNAMRERLIGYLRRSRLVGEDAHSQLVRLRTDQASRQALFDEMTIQETSFFRDPGQFIALAANVLATLPDPVTVWSAGCSNGQEAWSLAMVLAEQGRDGVILATDVSQRAVDRAREGIYSARELRGLDPARRHRWLQAQGENWRIVDELRTRVRVTRHNLILDPPPAPSLPVIFCRNVLIYFPRPQVEAVLARFHEALPRDGWLFLGFSESLWKVDQRFLAVRLNSSYVHRIAASATAAAPVAGGPGAPARISRRAARRPSAGAVRNGRTPEVEQLPAVAALLASGDAAMQRRAPDQAATAFRAATYLAPGRVLPHLQLSLALDDLGQRTAARRAMAAAAHALDSRTDETARTGLEEWDVSALRRFIEQRLNGKS